MNTPTPRQRTYDEPNPLDHASPGSQVERRIVEGLRAFGDRHARRQPRNKAMAPAAYEAYVRRVAERERVTGNAR